MKRRRSKIHRATVRFTDADDAVLAELEALRPLLRTTSAHVRYALKIARWYLRQSEAGGTVCVRFDNGRVVDAPIDW